MQTVKLIILATLISFKTMGQSCSYENLSKDFNFAVTLISKSIDSIQITVRITDKTSTEIQTLQLDTDGFYLDSFNDCDNVKSFSTKINSELPVGGENDSGNLIIADFNFDGLEDIAVQRDPGGNGGAIYAYFIQTADKQFYKNSYLTDTVIFFPIEMDSAKKTITTLVHANAYQMNRQVFKYIPKRKKWKLISNTFES